MSGSGEEFRIRPGRIRDTRIAKPKSFINRVLRAAKKAGHMAAQSGAALHASGFGRSTFGRGRIAFSRNRLFSTQRRVVVKARIAHHQGRAFRSAPMSTHLSYLKRDGVTSDSKTACVFDAEADRADDAAFSEQYKGDRHHFRFIVSPEDAAELSDTKAFTRDLMSKAERDLGTRLDWVAVDHWNTEHPHIHVIVRGRAENGEDLVIARDYIREGVRARAQQLLALELGPRSECEIHRSLDQQAGAERWTRLDRTLAREAATHGGIVDLRPDSGLPLDEFRSNKIGRMRKLEALGLANPTNSAQWSLSENAEEVLRELGERGDIIKRIHRSLTEKGWERAAADFVLRGEAETAPVTGRLVSRGLDDELKGSAFVVIDGVDGRAHHVRLPDLDAAGDSEPGSIVELRRYEDRVGRQRIAIAVRSDCSIADQVTAKGATWLDRQLVSREAVSLSDGGFGHEVREAMNARIDHLVEEGLARRQGQRVLFGRELLETLRKRDLEAIASKLAAETGVPYQPAVVGEHVAGLYRQRVTLVSGRFAMIDNGLGFSLVPWSPALEHHLGRQVSGIAQNGGGIDWNFGRKRGLGI